MKKLFYILPVIALTSACASFKPDYVIRDASENSRPSWTVQKNAYKSDDSANKKKYRYYVNDAENPDQNLCLNLAESRATQKVASEISQEIMSKFKEKSSSKDDESNRTVKNELERNIQVNLHGVAVTGKYWEKRAYSTELGAEKNKIGYKCDVAVRISNSALAEALEAYKAKTMRQLSKDDQKAMNAAVDATIDLVKTGAPLAGAVLEAAVGAN